MSNQEVKDVEESFYAIGPDGKEVKYDVLFTCESNDGSKHYIVYTDHSVDEGGNVRVFASTYTPGVENMELKPLETEKEWKIIEFMLEEIKAQIESKTEQ